MGNLLRDIFDPNSEYNKRLRKKLKDIEREMIESHDCCYCKNAIHPPHIEMGKFAGTDTYCRLMKEYKHYGDTCLFYNFNEVFKEKQMENKRLVLIAFNREGNLYMVLFSPTFFKAMSFYIC